jgi:ubiquitin-conjugating enzyme E2 J2
MSSANKAGVMRLQKEFKALSKEFTKQIEEKGKIEDNFVAAPDPNDIFTWYFVVFGLEDHPWKGGYYMGKLMFPKDYPWKPPGIMLITDSGRFKTNAKICLSISDYHPESWNPVLTVRSIIIGLVSFFVTNMNTVGALTTNLPEQAKIALASKKKIIEHK